MQIASFLLVSNSLALLGRADADFTCEALDGVCTAYGTQGSCCGGYTCVGNQGWASCKVDPNLDTSNCIDVWGQSCDNDNNGGCCLGNYCSDEGWGFQCKPNPRDTDCGSKQINSPTQASTTSAPSTPTPADNLCFSPNLGDGFSGATGNNAYSQNWSVQNVPNDGIPLGRDDSVAFFVGGDYFGMTGAEVEGKMVVLGNLKNNGINSFVQVGLGSQIIPNNDQNIILVGGDFENNYSGLVVMQNSEYIKGHIVYKGEYKNETAKIWSNGDIRRDPNLDLSEFEDNLEELKVKSHYWSTLHANGKYTPYNKGPNGNTCLFEAVDDECVQVFNLSNDELDNLPWGIHVQFHDSLKDKTVLINMASDSNNNAKVTNLANFFDPWGKGGWEFNSGFIANILWNFHDAEFVDIGGGTTGTGEFTGSIIVPNGGLNMGFPGQSGRTIVGGDLTQDRAGSEFHSFPYDPVCALPLPPCEPTSAPTPAGPYPGYTPLDSPSITTVGVSQPNGGNPIVIGEQNCTDISFGLTNTWGITIDYIFVQYHDLQTGLLVCEAFKNMSTSWFVEFSSKCWINRPISIVKITAVDSSFSAGDTAYLVDCCGDNEILGEIAGATQNIVMSTYVLDCCPVEVNACSS